MSNPFANLPAADLLKAALAVLNDVPNRPTQFNGAQTTSYKLAAAITDHLNPPAGTCRTYTAFCRHVDGTGTTWIDTIQLENFDPRDEDQQLDAKRDAEGRCADDWDCSPDDVQCIGIAEGDVSILLWED